MTSKIFYTPKPKPQPTPTPEKAPVPAPDRVTIGWGEQGRLQFNRSKAPESDRLGQTNREGSGVLRPTPVEMPRGRVEQVDRYSKLERIGRPKPLWEELAEQKRDFSALEYLEIRKVGSEYWITERGTGEALVEQTFETRQHCAEAAVEVEQKFDMEQVLELRLPETMERIEDLAEWHYLKEWVALGLV